LNRPIQVPNKYLDTTETLDRIVRRMYTDQEFTLKMVTSVNLQSFLKDEGYEISGAPLEVLATSMKKVRTYTSDQIAVLSKKLDEFVRGAYESGNGAGGWA
jgi:hypothetical protein